MLRRSKGYLTWGDRCRACGLKWIISYKRVLFSPGGARWNAINEFYAHEADCLKRLADIQRGQNPAGHYYYSGDGAK